MSTLPFRRGAQGYAVVMRLLLERPRTALEASSALAVRANSMRAILRHMHLAGLIHIGRWQPPEGRGCHQPVWNFGAGPDAPAPPSAKHGRPSLHPAQYRQRPSSARVEIMAFAEVWAKLAEPVSVLELAEHMATTRASIYRILRTLRALNLARIAEWERRIGVCGAPTPYWQRAIDQRDAPRPKPEDPAEVCRRYDRKRRARARMVRINQLMAGNTPAFKQAA